MSETLSDAQKRDRSIHDAFPIIEGWSEKEKIKYQQNLPGLPPIIRVDDTNSGRLLRSLKNLLGFVPPKDKK